MLFLLIDGVPKGFYKGTALESSLKIRLWLEGRGLLEILSRLKFLGRLCQVGFDCAKKISEHY